MTVGEDYCDALLKKALAIGADEAIRINAFPLDSYFVAFQIAKLIESNNYDIVLMGRESIDFSSGTVHSMVAEMVKWPLVLPCTYLSIENNKSIMIRELENTRQKIEIETSFIAACQEPIAEWKIPTMRGIMRARSKLIKIQESQKLSKKVGYIDLKSISKKRKNIIIKKDNLSHLIEELKYKDKVL